VGEVLGLDVLLIIVLREEHINCSHFRFDSSNRGNQEDDQSALVKQLTRKIQCKYTAEMLASKMLTRTNCIKQLIRKSEGFTEK
jgi:hypothetical protein